MKGLGPLALALVAIALSVVALVRTAGRDEQEAAPPRRIAAALVATQNLQVNLASSAGVTKTASGNVFGVRCINRNASAVYLQLFNQTTTPANSTVPQDQWFVPATSSLIAGQELTIGGEAFDAGVAFGVSTTAGTLTAAPAASSDVMLTFQ